MIDLNRINSALSSYYWKFEVYENPNCTLIDFLKQQLPQIDPNSWQSRINWGGLHLNGIRIKENTLIKVPAKIEYYEPKYDLNNIENYFAKFNPDHHIIYEDHDLLVLFKPNRISSLPAKEQDQISIYKQVSEYCKTNIHMPSRLDKSTCGLLAISKNKDLHNRLQQIYEKRQVRKFYLLETSELINFKTQICNLKIKKSDLHPILRACSNTSGSKATTVFTKITDNLNCKLVLAKPISGRTHQIRLHISAIASPIIGDNFYMGTADSELHLCSYALIIPHPRDYKLMYFEVPKELMPKWCKNLNKQALKELINKNLDSSIDVPSIIK